MTFRFGSWEAGPRLRLRRARFSSTGEPVLHRTTAPRIKRRPHDDSRANPSAQRGDGYLRAVTRVLAELSISQEADPRHVAVLLSLYSLRVLVLLDPEDVAARAKWDRLLAALTGHDGPSPEPLH